MAPPLHLVFAATWAADDVLEALVDVLDRAGFGRVVPVAAPYAGLLGWLRDSASPWHAASSSCVRVGLLRAEDLLWPHPQLRLAGVLEAERLLLPPPPGAWSRADASAAELLGASVAAAAAALGSGDGGGHAPTLLLRCPSPPSWEGASEEGSSDATAPILCSARAVGRWRVLPPAWLLHRSGAESSEGDTGAANAAAASHPFYYSPSGDLHGHAPYAAPFVRVLASALARWVAAAVAPLRKVLVLDCDNTLWQGAVGELGARGVHVGPEHAAVHAIALEAHASGDVLCLATRNAPGAVDAVFASRGAELRGLSLQEHVAVVEAGWGRKSAALVRIAARLGLPLEAFAFVDDSALECAEVAAALPAVAVLRARTDEWAAAAHPARAAAVALAGAWALDTRAGLEQRWVAAAAHCCTGAALGSGARSSASTAEDAFRTRLYREHLARAEARARDAAAPFGSFLSSLCLRTTFARLCRCTLARAAQLTVRTNQLNASKRPLSEEELAGLAGLPPPLQSAAAAAAATSLVSGCVGGCGGPGAARGVVVHVVDRFGAYGLVGLIVVGAAVEDAGGGGGEKGAHVCGGECGQEAPAVASPLHPPSTVLPLPVFLLSCRVMQWGVEHAMLRHAGELAQAAGAHGGLALAWTPSDRNEPMRAFVASLAPGVSHRAAPGPPPAPPSAPAAAALVAAARAFLAAHVAERAAAGDAGALAACAPLPHVLALPVKGKPCRFGARCERLGLDDDHALRFTHEFVWGARARAGVSKEALDPAWRAFMTAPDAGAVFRARLVKALARADRAFLGSLPLHHVRSTAGDAAAAGSAAGVGGALLPPPPAGTFFIPLATALAAQLDADAVDAAAEASANAARGAGLYSGALPPTVGGLQAEGNAGAFAHELSPVEGALTFRGWVSPGAGEGAPARVRLHWEDLEAASELEQAARAALHAEDPGSGDVGVGDSASKRQRSGNEDGGGNGAAVPPVLSAHEAACAFRRKARASLVSVRSAPPPPTQQQQQQLGNTQQRRFVVEYGSGAFAAACLRRALTEAGWSDATDEEEEEEEGGVEGGGRGGADKRSSGDRAAVPDLVWLPSSRIAWDRVLSAGVLCACYPVRTALVRKDGLAALTARLGPPALMPASAVITAGGVTAFEGLNPVGPWVVKDPASNNAEGLTWVPAAGGRAALGAAVATVLERCSSSAGARATVVVQDCVPEAALVTLRGAKFHCRVNVLAVGSCAVYVHRDVVCHVAVEPLHGGDGRDPGARPFAHVTNNVVARQHPLYRRDTHTLLLGQLLAAVAEEGAAVSSSGSALSEAAVFALFVRAVRRVFDAALEGKRCAWEPLPPAVGGAAACSGGGAAFMPLPQCFELFGADFLLTRDSAGAVCAVLLEINSGPALEGRALPQLCAAIARDTVRLVLDPATLELTPREGSGEGAKARGWSAPPIPARDSSWVRVR